jgi:hypothetical protein
MFAATSALAIIVLAFVEPAEPSLPFQVFSVVSDKWYVAKCTEEMVSGTPRWDEKAESPPLSPKKAIGLATKTKDSFFKNRDDFSLAALTLARMKEGWVWCVRFEGPPKKRGTEPPEAPEAARAPDTISLVVLMDGTVPEPVESRGFYGAYGVAPQPEDDEPADQKKSSDSK